MQISTKFSNINQIQSEQHVSIHEISYLEEVRLLPAKRKPDRQKAVWKLNAWAGDGTCRFPDKKNCQLTLKICIGIEEHERK